MKFLGEKLIFAIAQKSFETHEGNRFSTVIPIATLGGELLDRQDFTNRGLCWWMLRGVGQLINAWPGRLMVGQVEDALHADKSNLEKDNYQLRIETVQLAGPKNIMEILTIPDDRISAIRDLINQPDILFADHEPTPEILVRWRGQLYGPLRTDKDEKVFLSAHIPIHIYKQTIEEPINIIDENIIAGKPGHMKTDAVVAMDSMEPNRSSFTQKCTYEFISWPLYEYAIAHKSDAQFIFTDEEALSRVSKKILTRREQRKFVDSFRHIKEVIEGDRSFQQELDQDISNILKNLGENVENAYAGVDTLVNSLLEDESLEPVIQEKLKEEVDIRINLQATQLRAKAEEEIQKLSAEVENVERELQNRKTEFERIKRQELSVIETQRKEKNKEIDLEIQKKKETIEKESKILNQQRDVMEKNLAEVVERFRNEKDGLINHFLTLQPLLESLGMCSGQPSAESTRIQENSSAGNEINTEIELPHFVTIDDSEEDRLSEEDFFERFYQHVENSGFKYNKIDLAAFHLGVKCGDLTILGGLSGTGKSSLSFLYSQALAGDSLDAQKRFLAIDINPSWTNPGDILGYLNVLDSRFQPSSSGLFTHLIWAAEESQRKETDSGIYLVCLDEMNLAQVEHYFSDFIQALSRMPNHRILNVFDPSSLHPEDPYRMWAKISLNQNLRFVGTVNFDETTREVSQRTLDRSNLIQLQTSNNLPDLGGGITPKIPTVNGRSVKVNDFSSWVYNRPLSSITAELLEKIQEPLFELGCPLTPRRQSAIALFLGSAPSEICPPEIAIDLQIAQRIIPQIRGLFHVKARQAIGNLIKVLEGHRFSFERTLSLIEEKLSSEDLSYGIEKDEELD